MKVITFACGVAYLLTGVFLSMPVFGATQFNMNVTSGLYGGDTVIAGERVVFTIEWVYTPGDGSHVTNSTNGFRVWTQKNGLYTDNFSPITFDTLSISPSWAEVYDGGVWLEGFGVDGMNEDTAGFSGFTLYGLGIPDGFVSDVWYLETTPSAEGDTVCIDSSWYPPSPPWIWSTDGALGAFQPGWSGPYCFHVYKMPAMLGGCNDTVEVYAGDNAVHQMSSNYDSTMFIKNVVPPPSGVYGVDGLGVMTFDTDPADRGHYLFEVCVTNGLDTACCPAVFFVRNTVCLNRGDADGNGDVNIADLSYLVNYRFKGGPPAACFEEGDVNGDGGNNIVDITYLVDFLFKGGPPPPPCP